MRGGRRVAGDGAAARRSYGSQARGGGGGGESVARHSSPVVTLALVLAACTQSDRPRGELRFWTDEYALRVSSTPSPPRARARALYRVVITDKESGRPMERAEGQVYASNGQGTNIFDALEPGPELGTYYATLRFINAGEWALNMRFRGAPGDSIETAAPDGWRQIVGAAAQ